MKAQVHRTNDQLFNIKANEYTIDDEIKFNSPARSVQMILIEKGSNHIIVNDSILTGVNSLKENSFRLNQNYPNPVNSTTLISYQLQDNTFVTLDIFDFQGRKIITLVKEYQNEGNHSVQFNVSGLQNGVYL